MTENYKSSTWRLGRLWNWLTEPAASIKEPGRRRQARLLASLLLSFIAVTTPVAIALDLLLPYRSFLQNPMILLIMSIDVFFAIAYGLNRAGRFTEAAILTVGVSDVGVFVGTIIGFLGATPYRSDDVFLLVYVLVPVLFGSMLLSTQALIVITALNIVGILILPVLFLQITFSSIITSPLSFILIVSTLVVLATQHQNRLEKDRQAELVEKEERYRSLLEITFEGIAIYQGGRPIDANPGFARMFGYTPPEITGMQIMDFVAENSRDLIAQNIESGDEQPCEALGVKKDGTDFHIELVAKVHTYQGRAAQIFAIRDITERGRAEEQIRYQADLVESVSDAIISSDLNFNIKSWNRAAETIYGWQVDEVIGKPVVDVTQLEYPYDQMEEVVEQFFEKGYWKGEIIQKRKDGILINVLTSVSLIKDNSGNPVGAVAINHDITKRKLTEDALQQYTDQLEALRQVGLELTAQLDLDVLLHSIVSQAMELLGGDSGGLYLYRPERDVLEWSVSTGLNAVAPIGTILNRGEGLSGKVWETGEPLVVDDYAQWEGRLPAWEDDSATAIVGVPVRWGEEFMGVLDIAANGPRTFSLADANILSLFATQAAIAIQNARLYEQAQHEIIERKQAEAEAQRRAAHATLIYEVGQRISGKLELDELLSTIVTAIRDAFDYYSVALFLLDEEAKHLIMQAIVGSRQTGIFPKELQLAIGEGMIGYAAETGETQISGDVSQNPHYVDKAKVETKSELAVPIKSGQKVIGVFDLQSDEFNAFDETDVMVIETLVDQAAVAIENARLYKQAQQEIAEREQAEQALRVKDAAMESAITAIALSDLEGKLTYVNRAFLTMWGYDDRQQVLGRNTTGFWQFSDRAAAVIQALKEVGGWIGKLVAERKDGSTFTALVSASMVEDDAGEPVQMMASLVDMTHREKADEMLRQHIERLEILHDIDGAILAAMSPEEIAQAALGHIRRLVLCHRASVALFDFEANEAIILAVQSGGKTKLGAGARLSLEGAEEEKIKSLRQGKAIFVEDIQNSAPTSVAMQTMQAEGLRSYLVTPLCFHKELIGALALWSEHTDILGPEHVQVAKEVANSLAIAIQHANLFESVMQQRERLHTLTARLAEAEEEERRRLAQILHDQIGQNLTVLGLNLNLIRAQIDREASPLVLSRLDDSLALVEETTERTRHVMTDLRPPMLDDYGLIYTLRWYGEQFTSRTGVAVTMQGEEPVPRLAAQVENIFFRIAQEALTNVTKHARASQVTIAVTADDQSVRLAIADDGVGFDQTQLAMPNETQGWGLLTMTERAEAIGAHCRIESHPQQGTQVIVEVAR